ncbi:MAG: hypothetical protein GDA37_04500 [Ekhidna sp.]|nr:hypothetical protein [Ekhidna sp.]
MAQITEEQRTILSGLAKRYVTVDQPTPILETPKDYGLVSTPSTSEKYNFGAFTNCF